MNSKIILRPKEDSTVTFSIRVDKELLENFNKLSNQSGYSRNELINFSMKHYIETVEFIDNEDNK